MYVLDQEKDHTIQDFEGWQGSFITQWYIPDHEKAFSVLNNEGWWDYFKLKKNVEYIMWSGIKERNYKQDLQKFDSSVTVFLKFM